LIPRVEKETNHRTRLGMMNRIARFTLANSCISLQSRLFPSVYQTQIRTYLQEKKRDKREALRLKQEKFRQKNLAQQSAVEFATLLRQLYRKSHPDLLRHSHPEIAEMNDHSMQVLNGILSTIKTEQFPQSIWKDITFHLKVAGTNELKPYVLQIRTGGGDCKNHLTQTFTSFFMETGILESDCFAWNKEYFPVTIETNVPRTQIY
jgi:hypothetical protein